MPEQIPKRRNRMAWTLSRAHDTGQLVRVRCLYCSVTHNYRPDDLRRLFGDIATDDIENRIRCEKCRRKDYLQVTLWIPTAAELQGLRVRRLVHVETRRFPVWKEGPA